MSQCHCCATMTSWWIILGLIPILDGLYTPESSTTSICQTYSDAIDCSHLGLSQLPTNLNYNVSQLDASFNKLEIIPSILKNFKNLQHLNLSFNKISSLGHTDFSELGKLRTLDLSFNLFHDWKDIHVQTLTPLTNLTYLDFSNNPLRSLPLASNHLKLKSLQTLKLNNCSMATFSVNVLSRIPNLKELYIGSNIFQRIEDTLESNTLRFIDISGSSLEYFTANLFQNVVVLETLILNNNKYLRNITVNSNSLTYLDLSNCNLESVPSGNLRAVRTLLLQENFIKTLITNSFINYPNLVYLNISTNAISMIEDNTFRGLDSLQILDLSVNKLSSISEKILLPTISLIELHLSHNYINFLDTLTSSSLRTLDVSFCEIYSISKDSLLALPRLKNLTLARNFISSLPDGWTGDRLVYLDLSGCRIKSINNKTFEQMSHLRRINLSGNRLITIDPFNFPQVLYVSLEDNQWRCDCQKLKIMYEWMLDSNGGTDALLCDSPEKVEGLTWLKACETVWYPEMNKAKQLYWYTIIIIVSMVMLLATIIVLRKLNSIKEKRQMQVEEHRREQEREAREALQRMQQLQRDFVEEADRNAPDPRENQGPPSYTDALLMPRLDSSHPSLAGSLHSISGRPSLHGSNQSINKKNKVRRKRRRRKSEESRENRLSRTLESDTDSEPERIRPPLESDF